MSITITIFCTITIMKTLEIQFSIEETENKNIEHRKE